MLEEKYFLDGISTSILLTLPHRGGIDSPGLRANRHRKLCQSALDYPHRLLSVNLIVLLGATTAPKQIILLHCGGAVLRFFLDDLGVRPFRLAYLILHFELMFIYF